ncbi:TrkH family potassium uptake protein [Paenibacillus radicis (ex Xue et al. 2023)]|uniref:TrkH family potassium uptake protein n=1 Tax=Paenibacillus radicis (ex Xue et al. 2023) TaxID=2972489 RepID=A0ABT1YMZ1_9BACL|nr:TrkH family potassium uptake protein [Paenibacillus radicis (ex Xue et al. 2023)]MCR8633658.1 TrkH family potassium uptake protein [Paenibacillus radicis (ex Xue et al. 2023)]
MKLRLSKFIKLTPSRVLSGGFALIICLGTFLLYLPISLKSGNTISFIDALFTATSALCVTGLIVVDTGTHFSVFGQIILLLLIQAGGVGFMTVATWFAIALKKQVSLSDRLILTETLNQNTMEGIVRLIRKVLIYSLTIESIAAVLFLIRWSQEMPLGKAVYFSIFHSVSIFNNAGFELMGGFTNLTPYIDDYFINIVSMALVLLGGIGFIVISDIMDFPKTRKLSIHSKVVLVTTAILTAISAVCIFIFEYANTNTLGNHSWTTKIVASLFQSITLRSAGVNTIDIANLHEATQFLMIIMMFIGAAPGSTGGGIKLTTFAVLVGALLSMIRGKEDVVMFRHRLPQKDIYKAVTLTVIAVFIVVTFTMILSVLQGQDFLMILFETASAFGTVGLSMGLTQHLTFTGKIIIILLMFTGRIGLLTLAFSLLPKHKKDLYRYPEGKITIG